MKKGFRILKFKKDKPIFEVKDINKQNLAITSFNDGKINANVKLDEKRF